MSKVNPVLIYTTNTNNNHSKDGVAGNVDEAAGVQM